MKKRPLCAICILFLVIQCARLLLFGTEDARSSELEEAAAGGVEAEAAGIVYRIEEKKKVTAVCLKDCIVSVPGKEIRESQILVYISSETMKDDPPEVGNRLRANGEAAPFEQARNPGNFDQRAYYQRQGLHVLLWADSAEKLSGDTDVLHQALFRLRTEWDRLLVRHLGSYYGGTMSAILLGDKSGLDAQMKKIYQKNGISHLLAISGLHMTFLGMGFYRALRRAGGGFLLSGTAGAVLLIGYSLMIGAGVSSLRALLMFAVRIGAEVSGRDYDLPTSLFLSAAVLCAWQPLYLTDAGIQLSYGAILGIADFTPVLDGMFGTARIRRRMKEQNPGRPGSAGGGRISRVRVWLLESLSTSLSVNTLLLGPLLYFYYEVPPYSVFLNLLVIPVMPAAMAAGIAGSFLALIWEPAGGALLQVCRAVLWGYDMVCRVFGMLPFSRYVTGKPDLLWLVVYYGVLAAACAWFYRKRWRGQPRENGQLPRLPGVLLLAAGVCMAVACRQGHCIRQGAEVTVLDVGQGDGIHIRGAGLDCLIDGGSSDVSSVGTYRLEPYLLSEGVDRLDYVFVTHGDEDHISGIRELLEGQELGVEIETLVLPPKPYQDEKLRELAEIAADSHTRVAYMGAGGSITREEKGNSISITCYAPAEDGGYEPGNEASLVLALTCGDFGMLFAGDLEGAGEEDLVRSGALPACDVLKVAHHGSEDSGKDGFLELTGPSVAVISAGVGNRYGHPHPETLRRLERAGCTAYSTQENGAVTVRTDGEEYSLRGFLTDSNGESETNLLSKTIPFYYNREVMKSLNEDLKTGQFRQIYLLYGPEAYLKKQYRDRFVRAMAPEGDTMNCSVFEGKKTDIKEVVDLAETLPFFAERRLIVFEDTGFFKSGGNDLADYISGGMPPTTCFLFVEDEVDKRSRLYKAVKAKGHAVELAVQEEGTLRRWVTGLVKKEKKDISGQDTAYFISKVGTDMENITKELEKLFCYCLDRSVITREDIDAVCVTHITSRIFDMVNAVAARQQERALGLYYDLLALKEPPMRILSLMSREYRDLFHVRELLAQGYGKKDIASKAGLHPFAAGKYMDLARHFGREELRAVMEESADLEQRVKTGRMTDHLAVELFIVKHSGAQ